MNGFGGKSLVKALLMVGAVLLLNACHTVAGVGADISHVGKSIERQADKHAP